MRMMLTRLAVLCGAALLLLAAACGDGDDGDGNGDGNGPDGATGSLEEYVTDLEPVAQEFADARAELVEDFDFENASEEDRIRTGDDLFDHAAEAVGEYTRGVGRLDPSPEVLSFHEETQSVGQALEERLGDAEDEAQNASEVGAIDSAYDELLGSGGALEELLDLCSDAQSIAEDNDIAVDLRCEE